MHQREDFLPIGSMVKLYGTTGDTYRVVAYRIAQQGIWYTFVGATYGFGDKTQGYREMVKEVISR